VDGSDKLVPACSTIIRDGMKIVTNNEKVRSSRKTALELLFSNHYADCVGPCMENCPAGVDAQAYIALTSMGKYREAIKLVKENNPLPLSIGRVCVRECENACRRNLVDEPVACNYLKRYIADIDKSEMWIPDLKPKNGRKVAIIGGGPAGLTCACYLALEGYSPVIFEKLPELGGMLRYGIPEYRLPKKILDEEINWILNLGVESKTGIELGKDFSLSTLFDDGYESVFIGIGAHKAAVMGLEDEDTTGGILKGIDFLRDVNSGIKPLFYGTVIIVGGGNTAIDAARTALRCGADKVKIIYRRSIKEMPASREEIEAAQKEGIEILFLTNPKSIISENSRLKGIECLKQKLEPKNIGERPQPVPIPGSEYKISCDFIIGAIGQKVDNSFVHLDKKVALEKWGTVTINQKTFETSIPGVFAGGDAVTGPLTAVSSIAQGKKAANAIIGFLETGTVKAGAGKFLSSKKRFGEPAEREYSHIKKLAREKLSELEVTDRIHSFDEVEKGITSEQSLAECARCLECGCSEYYDCALRKYGDEYGVDISGFIGETKKHLIDSRHPLINLDPNKCINCGKCVRTCSEILKVSALGFVNRGFRSVVKPAMEKSLEETNCIACGNCIDACPTGAISEKFPFKILGTLPKENYESVCGFCSVGCIVNFKKINDEIYYVSNSTESIQDSHNKGYLCIKGRFGHRYLMDRRRITSPIIRRNGLVHEAGIEEALDYAAMRIKKIVEKYGNDSVAICASPRLSNEELYLLQKFARKGLRNNNITSFSNLSQNMELNIPDNSLGGTVSAVKIKDLERADVIVVMNSNLSEENLVLELKIKDAQKKGTKVVAVSSSENKLTRDSDLWIDGSKGTNTLLLDSMMKIFLENNLADAEFVKTRTERYDDFKKNILKLNLNETIGLINIDFEKFLQLFRILNKPESNIVFVYNIDSKKEKSPHDLKAIANFMLMTGRSERQFNGILLLRDHCNSAGSADMGVTPDYLPGYVMNTDKERIEQIGNEWGVDLEPVFRKNDLELKIKSGGLKALLLFGEDPLSDENNRKYFSGIEFLLASDSFVTTTSLEADLVLPASTFIEQEGSFTGCDHTFRRTHKIIKGNCELSNWEIIENLARNFSGGFNHNSYENVLDELKRINSCYQNLDEGESWIGIRPGNSGPREKFSFSIYDSDLRTFDRANPVIHFQENYYISNIKL
jgi:formate dehydrogenase major subunit